MIGEHCCAIVSGGMMYGRCFRDIFGGGGISTFSGIIIYINGDFGIGVGRGSCNIFVRSTLGCAWMIAVVVFKVLAIVL